MTATGGRPGDRRRRPDRDWPHRHRPGRDGAVPARHLGWRQRVAGPAGCGAALLPAPARRHPGRGARRAAPARVCAGARTRRTTIRRSRATASATRCCPSCWAQPAGRRQHRPHRRGRRGRARAARRAGRAVRRRRRRRPRVPGRARGAAARGRAPCGSRRGRDGAARRRRGADRAGRRQAAHVPGGAEATRRKVGSDSTRQARVSGDEWHRPGRPRHRDPDRPRDAEARIAELGAQITRDYADDPPLLVCVLKGAFMFVADLVRAIDLPVQRRLHGDLVLRLRHADVGDRADREGPRDLDRGTRRDRGRGHRRLRPDALLPAEEPAGAAGRARSPSARC